MPEKQLSDYVKKIDFSDIRVLVVGLILLLVPVLFIFYLSSGSEKGELSRQKIKSMARRKNIFNYSKKKIEKKAGSAGKTSGKTGSSWFSSESPEKKVQRELEQAFKTVQRSRRSVTFPPGTTHTQRQAYNAETNPLICRGNGALENGNLSEAAQMFERALDESRDNVFQKVFALGGLMSVYEAKNDRESYEKAFEQYMHWVGQLPPGYGGGDLRYAVKNAYMALKHLQESADPAKVSQAIAKIKTPGESILPESEMKKGLSEALKVFPAKFD
jgi:tetratricopeptide (TPR) repeat protein